VIAGFGKINIMRIETRTALFNSLFHEALRKNGGQCSRAVALLSIRELIAVPPHIERAIR
jgi:hypothetical protein